MTRRPGVDPGAGEPVEAIAREIETPPPVGGSWGRLYLIVILWLLLQIALFQLFTVAFS